MLNRVLVPLDGSALAETALEYALQIVKPTGTITLVSAIQVPEYPIYDLYPVPMPTAHAGESADKAVPGAKSYLERVADRLRETTQLTISIVVDIADPATLIVDVAEHDNVDAIVMSTHGRTGVTRWFFGSVTSKVVMGAQRPVMVIPSKNRQHVEALGETAEKAAP